MRALWHEHGESGVGVPEDGIERIASRVAGRDLGDFFNRFVAGTDELPLADLLAAFGIGLTLRPSLGTADRGGKPPSGPLPRASLDARVGADMKLQHVYGAGAAQRAGLAAGDQIVAVDGLRATPDALRDAIERLGPGGTLRLHAFRRDELAIRDVLLSTPALDTCVLSIDDDSPAEAAGLRAAWLGSDRSRGS